MKDCSEQIFAKFRVDGDEAAFEDLMRQHGPMVFRAALSVLGDSGTAEDIAQATFFTLARKAASLEDIRSIAGWLHHVAVCLARKEYRGRLRRISRERNAVELACPPDGAGGASETAVAAMHEEIAALHELHRLPMVLHYLEGRSYEDAAAAIGCKVSTFGNRLTRAREKLRNRLIKRGITGLTTAGLVVALGETASAAELPAGFAAATCAAAKGGAVSAKVAALTQSALKMLFWGKVQTVAAVCAGVVLVGGAGIGVAVTLPLILQPSVGPVETVDGSAVTAGMVLVPGGTNAGTDLDAGKPYSLTVESFLMDRCEVTKALWDEVAAWGIEHGYVFEKQMVNGIFIDCGQGKAPDHPVHSVSWYDCVIWCNARSEKDGFTPAYYRDAACTMVYRRAQGGPGPRVKATADGYRLPTVVEWQYAACGGRPSHRFPWHDTETIDHSRANYYSLALLLSGDTPWDTSPTREYHPTYAVEPKPYTSPVGAFAPNAYGLYDLAGNVSEWCFDDYEGGMRYWKKHIGSCWLRPPIPVRWVEGAAAFLSRTDIGFRTVRTPLTVTDF